MYYFRSHKTADARPTTTLASRQVPIISLSLEERQPDLDLKFNDEPFDTKLFPGFPVPGQSSRPASASASFRKSSLLAEENSASDGISILDPSRRE